MNLKKTIFHLMMLFAAGLAIELGSIGAQEATENWVGTLDVKVAKLRLQLEINIDADGQCSGTMISLDQGSARIEMNDVVRTKKKLDFEIKTINASFSGTMNEDQTVVMGKFTQGATYSMEFKKVDSVKPDKHTGSWTGILQAAGQKFDFQFRFFEDGNGSPFAKLDSFSDSTMGISCEIEQDENEITILIPATRAKYVGSFSDDRQSIEGNWIQGGGKFPLELKRIPIAETRSSKLNRPQTPSPPFEYNVVDFVVKASDMDSNFDSDVELAGTLTSPRGTGPFPTVILISGSGPQDRDETILQHKPFFVIADHLTQKGFAVIRFDDRGVAKSKGNMATATSADFADDVEALFLWAKKNPKIDPAKIVLMGHSEGGLIAPIVASRREDVAGVVMLAGPGVSGDRIILNQSRKIAGVAGLPENILGLQDKLLRNVMDRLKSGKEFDEAFQQTLQSTFDQLPDADRKKFGLDDVAEMTVAKLNLPWMKFFVSYDPKESLAKTTCPVLSVIGERDLQVDRALNFPAIEAAMKAAGNNDFVQLELPELNHLFQKCKTGSPSEYVAIEQTSDASLLNTITKWLEKRFKD